MQVEPLFSSADHHPIVISAGRHSSVSDLRDYLQENKEITQQRLRDHGAVLFRGFDLSDAQHFQACVESAGGRPFEYVGGDSPRTRLVADVYTSTDYPASEIISLHNEMSYLPSWPRRLFFFCAVAPAAGGQTSLAHGGDVLGALDRRVAEKFRAKGVKYIRNFHPNNRLGKSWQATYQTEDRAEVERIVANQGSACSWSSTGVLRVSTVCPSIITHPSTHQEVWFNQAEQYHPSSLEPSLRMMLEDMVGAGRLPHECQYGDGEPISESSLADVRNALDRCKLLFDWRRGDLLMIDNILMMHGREAYTGERRIQAYLSST